MVRRKLVAGNWKMHKTRAQARAFVRELRAALDPPPPCDLAVFPPFTALSAVAEEMKGTNVVAGAQDLFWEKEGAFTGEVSAEMIREAGGEMVLVGHSERRHVLGEDDAVVVRKLGAALAGGLRAVLCVGEKMEQRKAGRAQEVVGMQIESALFCLDERALERVVVAYEPVWAIGTGLTARPEDAVTMHMLIRKLVADRFGTEVAGELLILYGGSVKPDNAGALLSEEEIDGALVGGASLEVSSFLAIARAACV